MKKHTLLTVLVCACVWMGPNASETTGGRLQAESLEYPGVPYPCVYPDNRVTFRVAAPDAQKVRVRDSVGLRHEQRPGRLVDVTTTPQVIGFHYYTLSIDGAVVADPSTRTFFGSGCYNSAIEVPDPDADYYAPEGRAAREGAPALVPLESDRHLAARLCLHAARLRRQHQANIRCCTCCTAGARTSRAGTCKGTSTSSSTT